MNDYIGNKGAKGIFTLSLLTRLGIGYNNISEKEPKASIQFHN